MNLPPGSKVDFLRSPILFNTTTSVLAELAMGHRVIQTPLSTMIPFVIISTKYTKPYLNNSTAHG